MPLLRSKYQLAEPGIDPISNPIPHQGGGGLHLTCVEWMGLACGLILLIGFGIRNISTAQAAPKTTATPTRTATATSTATATATSTVTPTKTGTIAPTLPQLPPGFNTQTIAPVSRVVTQPPVYVPVYQTVVVKETVIYYFPVTVVVTQTFTPMPSRTPTPTEVVIDPSATSLPSLTPTPSETVTSSVTATEEPTETPVDTETESAE